MGQSPWGSGRGRVRQLLIGESLACAEALRDGGSTFDNATLVQKDVTDKPEARPGA